MTKKRILYWLGAMLGFYVVWGCATQQTPEGGPTDNQPPRLDARRYSTPNKATNFQEDEIILTFDEWVRLDQAQQKVIISPPFEEEPEIKLRNKSLVVKFKEPRKPNTTYTINFADVVKDITENNAADNLNFVFSTGDYLDSLTLAGEVIDAKTGEAVTSGWAMLYDDLGDSVLYNSRPYYLSKVDKDGRFQFEHLKQDTFQIVVLDDKNNNYQLDLPNETVAFWDSTFIITDSTQPAFRLRMFQEESKLSLATTSADNYGFIKFVFNRPHDNSVRIELANAPSDLTSRWQYGGDSVLLWYDGTMPEEDWQFLVYTNDSSTPDTTLVKYLDKQTFLEDGDSLAFSVSEEALEQHPKQPLRLQFNRTITQVDTNRISLRKRLKVTIKDTVWTTNQGDTLAFSIPIDSFPDSLQVDTAFRLIKVDSFAQQVPFSYSLDSLSPRDLLLNVDWQPKAIYQVQFLAKATTDLLGLTNTDTFAQTIKVNSLEDYGNLTATLINLDSAMTYTLWLVDENEKTYHDTLITGTDSLTVYYPHQKVGTYTLRILHDRNANGRWDVGSYIRRQQAETITNSKPLPLKSGWENEMKVDLAPPKEEE